MIFEHLTSENGLQNNNILSITQDDYGFLWLGTDNGLHRYDGLKFILFEHESSHNNSISGNVVFKILTDKDNQLWICSNGGFDKFNPSDNSFTHIPANQNYVLYCPSGIVDDSGNIYVSESHKGIFKLNKEKLVLEKQYFTDSLNREVDMGIVTNIFQSKDGIIWFGSKNKGLFSINMKTRKSKQYSKENYLIGTDIIYNIYQDGIGRNFVGTDKGLYLLNKNQSKFELIDNRAVFAINQISNGDLWFGTNNDGLLVLKKGTTEFENYMHDDNNNNSLNSNGLRTIYEDKQGNIWTGTYKGGINYVLKNNGGVFNLNKKESKASNTLSYKSIDAIYEDKNRNLWFGTDGGGLNLYDVKKNKYKLYDGRGKENQLPPLNSSLSIIEDSYGNIWTGGYLEGVCKLNKHTNTYLRLKNIPGDSNSLGNNDVRCLYVDKENNFWVATNGGGLNLLDIKSKKFKRFTQNGTNSVVSNYCLTVFQDSKDQLWIGTYGGFSVLDKNRKTFKNYNKETTLSSLSSNWIYVIYEDSKGRIWLGTDYGLNLFNEKTGKCSVYLKKDGLPNNEIAGILEDDMGNLWISTNGGLCKLDPDKMTFKTFDSKDGLQINHFSIASYYKTKNGNLYFGGNNGVTWFDPAQIKSNNTPPLVYITELILPDTTIATYNLRLLSKENPFELLYKDARIITFKFLALDYISSGKNQFKYFLEGFDKEWHQTGNIQSATYTNLDPGEYIFRVIASNNDGIWNKEGVFLKFIVNPPWYNTWWFKFFGFLLCAGLLLGFYFVRVVAIKKQNSILEEVVKARTISLKEANEQLIQKQSELERSNKTKDRFFSIIAHDLKNPVSSLALLTEVFKNEFKDVVNPYQKELIKHVNNSSERIKDLVINLLEWAKTQSNSIRVEKVNILLIDIFRDAIKAHEEHARQKEITIIAETHANVFVEADKNMINTIVRNILSNSIKYTPRGGKINLSSSIINQTATISVRDYGIGMEPEILKNLFNLDKNFSLKGTENETGTGLGITICKEFANLNNGKIFAESEVNKGTTFYIELPGGFNTENGISNDLLIVNSEPLNKNTIESPLRESKEKVIEKVLLKDIEVEAESTEDKKDNLHLVLIAEDNEELREGLERVLQDKFRVIKAVDGLEAIKLALRYLPDIIITDIMMPGLDGIGVCKKIKKDFNTAHIPVVMLTSLDADEDELKGIETGADDYVIKPFNSKILISRVSNLIETRKMLQKRFVADLKAAPGELSITSVDQNFIKNAIEVLEKRMEDPEFDVEQFSQEMNMSESSLYRKLKALSSQSPNQFIRTIRLKRAAQLLETNQFNVSEVCYKVGFNDIKYFRQCFQRQFGINPGEVVEKK